MRSFDHCCQSLLLLACAILACSVKPSTAQESKYFSSYHYGKTPTLYKQHGKKRQDASGAAWSSAGLMLAYDGGDNSEHSSLWLYELDDKKKPSKKSFWQNKQMLSRSVTQRDIEGATFLAGSYYTVSSMSLIDEESTGYRLLSQFRLNSSNQMVWERSVDLRNTLIKELANACSGKAWYARASNVFGKKGGLNIEAISFDPNNSSNLILGLRSPLCSPHFGASEFGESLSLKTGDAILVTIADPFDAYPEFEFRHVDLNGHGIRGMEFIETLDAFVIIGGQVEKADGYSLWLLPKYGQLTKLNIPGFDRLCRPESVTPITYKGKSGIAIFSEEAGKSCENVDITAILAMF